MNEIQQTEVRGSRYGRIFRQKKRGFFSHFNFHVFFTQIRATLFRESHFVELKTIPKT